MGLFNGKLFKGINKTLTKAWDVNVKGTKLVGASLFPGLGNYMATQEQNEANKKLQAQANKQNIDLWNQQTAYNDPSAQMKRLEAAGLSPQLAYGQLADSKASSPPEVSAPRMDAPHYTQSALDTLSTYQQVVNMHELNKKINNENSIVEENARYLKYENDYLIKNKLIKSDVPLFKMSGRVGDFVRLMQDKIGRSDLFRYLGDTLEQNSYDYEASKGAKPLKQKKRD